MASPLAVLMTCLLATSVLSTDLHSGYDPGSHGSDSDDEHESLDKNRGNNEWTPMISPGPSGDDAVIHHGDGAKTLVAGSPSSPVAEAINYYGPPPPPPPPPHVPAGYGIDSNQIQIPYPVRIPVLQPHKIVVHKKVPYEVRVPVRVPVPRPVPVPVPRPVQVPVDKPYEVIVERKVPFEVRVPVQVPVQVPYNVDVPQPYPVRVVVPKPVIIKHPVPVVIKYIKSGKRKGLFG